MRYFEREMHVGFFDGHVERIDAIRAWSEPSLWYPQGSRFEGGDATPEVMEALEREPGAYETVP
jgi:prepilin-type processing-associated H-X9-DG protein